MQRTSQRACRQLHCRCREARASICTSLIRSLTERPVLHLPVTWDGLFKESPTGQ